MARPLKLPAIGTELGPCVRGCAHKDCQATRAQAESTCPICGEPIGYEVSFYYTPDHDLEHAYCRYPNIYAKPEAR